MDRQVYIKVGKRYKPITWTCTCRPEIWQEGTHIVVSGPNSKFTKFNINPSNFALLAAAILKQDKICKIITKKLEMKPLRSPITSNQLKYWRKFVKAMGDDKYLVSFTSVQEICNAVIEELTS